VLDWVYPRKREEALLSRIKYRDYAKVRARRCILWLNYFGHLFVLVFYYVSQLAAYETSMRRGHAAQKSMCECNLPELYRPLRSHVQICVRR